MRTLRALALLLVTAASGLGCSSAGADTSPAPSAIPSHRLLDGLSAPPANKPVQPPSIEQGELKPTLPEGEVPGLVVLQDDQLLTGERSVNGTVAVTRDTIDIETPGQSTIRVLYRLPSGMQPLSEDRFDGRLELFEFSGPDGANRHLEIVRTDASPGVVLAQIWRTRPEPQSVELGGVPLKQAGLDTTAAGYTESPVTTDGQRVPLGEPTIVRSADRQVQLLVTISHLLVTEEGDIGQFGNGYILQAWAVGA
jgi:hypothetical protein